MSALDRLADAYRRRVYRNLSPALQKAVRQVLIVNGALLGIFGVIMALSFAYVIASASEPGEPVITWEVWAILGAFTPLALLGGAMHAVGRRLPPPAD